MAEPSSHMWYVQAAGSVWGPYPEAQLAGFVAEGRVGAATLVSPWATGPFAPVQASAEFAPMFDDRLPAVRTGNGGVAARSPKPASAIAASRPAPSPVDVVDAPSLAAHPTPVAAGTGPVRPLLVWIQHAGANALELAAALEAFGPSLPIRPGLWLVQARTPAATLRNLLSRKLGPQDTLLVVEAALEQAAWFNLDPGRDRELRRLWGASTHK